MSRLASGWRCNGVDTVAEVCYTFLEFAKFQARAGQRRRSRSRSLYPSAPTPKRQTHSIACVQCVSLLGYTCALAYSLLLRFHAQVASRPIQKGT